MALFNYKAIDANGKAILGQIDALNVVDLELRLKRMGLDLVVGGPTKRAGSFGRGVKRPELINFCFHLEQLSSSGVPLVEGLTDLRDSVENPRFREVISGLIEGIQGGQNLSGALSNHPEVFSSVFRALIKAGEDTGRLPEVLRSLVENLKWEDELRAQTKKLVMYPLFVGVVVLGVTFFLMVYLVPQMVTLIKTMGQTLPLHTRLLIAVSDFLVSYWWIVLAAPFLIFFGIKFAAQSNPVLPLPARRPEAQAAGDGTDPAQDHPVAVRERVRAHVLVGDHDPRCDPQLRGDRRQRGRSRKRCTTSARRSARART